jgi:adenylate kinase
MKRNRHTPPKDGGPRSKRLQQPEPFPQRLVLLGPPGVGKGTQGELLSTHLGVCHLSTGDIFRAARTLDKSDRTPTMTLALEYMQRGELVPDDIVLGMLMERSHRMCLSGGFILDGFPRTLAQAAALREWLVERHLPLDAVVSYEMPLEKIVARMSGRRVCPNCKAVYHLETRPPKVKGVCDVCGSLLYQREDDLPESVRVRMKVYQKSTAPLADFYLRDDLLLPISAEGTPEEILDRTIDALKKRQSSRALIEN